MAISHLVSDLSSTFLTCCFISSIATVLLVVLVFVFITFWSSLSAELCSCSVTLVSCLAGVIDCPHHADGVITGINSHCAVNVIVTQSSVVTQVHSGIILL